MIRRWLGIDGIDFLIQAGITMCVAVMSVELAGPNEEVMVGGVFAASLAILAWRRNRARERGELGPAAGQTTLTAAVEERLLELDGLQQRVYELEERLDFAERMLAQARKEPGILAEPPGAPPLARDP